MSTSEEVAAALPLDAKGLANLMLDWAEEQGRAITPMKLQKLLYFCHADYVVQFNKGLVKQEFEAWNYGPVIPSIYKEFKSDHKQPIRGRASIFDPVTATRKIASCALPADEEENVRSLFDFYSRFSAEKLSDLSHAHNGPWRQARSLFSNGLNMDRRIPSELIHRYHEVPHD